MFHDALEKSIHGMGRGFEVGGEVVGAEGLGGDGADGGDEGVVGEGAGGGFAEEEDEVVDGGGGGEGEDVGGMGEEVVNLLGRVLGTDGAIDDEVRDACACEGEALGEDLAADV